MRDEEIELAVCERQRRATVLHQKPFRMDPEQLANCVLGGGNGRNIFDLKQHLRESKGVMLTSRCSTLWSAATCRRFGLRRLVTDLVCGCLTPHSSKSPSTTWSRQDSTDKIADKSAHHTS